jgi:hypothetical protein
VARAEGGLRPTYEPSRAMYRSLEMRPPIGGFVGRSESYSVSRQPERAACRPA